MRKEEAINKLSEMHNMESNLFGIVPSLWGDIKFRYNSGYIKYKIIKLYSSNEPVLWDVATVDDFVGILKHDSVKYEIIVASKPGFKDKPPKPNELKSIQQIGSVKFAKSSCPVFVKGNDVFVKHNDYLSPIYLRSKDSGTPLSYRAKKYCGKNISDKFVYPDNWGGVVLRRVAWLRFTNFVPLFRFLNEVQIGKVWANELWQYHGLNGMPTMEWQIFFEEVSQLVLSKCKDAN